jgi:FkbM family methyltransferase
MRSRFEWLLTRPRTLFRAANVLGWRTALQLVRLRVTGSRDQKYKLNVPGYLHPIFIRGGSASDAVALYEVFVTHEYALKTPLESPAFIIDCGANVGMASLYFLNRYPAARVVSVEPSPANFELCRLNLEPYGDRVKLIQGAVWKSPGRLSLEANDQAWATRVSDDKPGTVEAFTVPALMAHGPGKVDLLKVDIEGSEGEVFGPDSQEWLPRVRNIAIELHGHPNKDLFFAALNGRRYDLFMHTSWIDPAIGPASSCYVAICENLRAESAA